MRKVFSILVFLISITTFAQQPTGKGAFLEKRENSKDYLIAIAEAMPEAHYAFKPTERQMSLQNS